MARGGRWAVVAVGVAVLVSIPFAAHLLPATASPVSARTLLARVRASATVPYAGYAQTHGALSLPSTDGALATVSDLFGGNQQLRVWWRSADDWRVDSLAVTGEKDLARDATGVWSWDYEANTAQRLAASGAQVRAPRSADLLPGPLARRLLSEAEPADVTRLGTKRIAGASAAGLRLAITDARSTVRHVDVWARPDDGLPLQVSVYGASAVPIVTSSLISVAVGMPPASSTAFTPPAGAQTEQGSYGDVVSAINRLGDSTPPASIGGLPRRTGLDLGAVGVYGNGATIIAAVPLPANLAGDIVPALRRAPGAVENAHGITASAGTVNVQVGPPVGFGDRWLLVGTVTAKTLVTAVGQLPSPEGFQRYFGYHGASTRVGRCYRTRGTTTGIAGGPTVVTNGPTVTVCPMVSAPIPGRRP